MRRILFRPVDVGSVTDPGEQDDPVLGMQLEEHPIVAPAGGPQAFELTGQGLAHPLRVLRKGVGHELDDRCSDARRESVEIASRTDADFDAPGEIRG